MINENCELILRDLYYYDVVSAFPTIMQSQHYDFKDVDLKNKEERNIFIGKEQRDNKYLSSFLNESISSLVDYYLTINKISDDNIIYRQKDGFILRQPLAISNQFIEMKLRSILTIMIITPDRQKMLYFDEFGELSVRGVRYYYKRLDEIFKMLYQLNFYKPKELFEQLSYIKNKIINNSDISFYGIEEDSKYTFMTKNGTITVRNLDFIDPDVVDRHKYFNAYFKPFFDSIFLEVMR